jgi:hypothetical protein
MVAAEAEVTMVIVADMLSSATMAAAITAGADTTDTVVAMAGAAATAGVADTDGVGGIPATVGDGVSALGGRIGVGDIRMATTGTARGITLPTPTLTRITVLRDTPVLLTETTTLHHRIPTPNPGRARRNLGELR